MSPLPVWQLFTVVMVPFMGILLGILLNQRAIDKLSGEIKDVRGEIKDVRGEMRDIRTELRDFRIQMHDEYVGLLNLIGDHSQRIVRLEERSQRQ